MYKARKRRKGGGRKFADKKISKVQVIRSARDWFRWNTSVKGFLTKRSISRQTYYRLLANNSTLKAEITHSRLDQLTYRKEWRRQMFAWLKENPDKDLLDYHLRDIQIPEVKITFADS